MFLVGKRAFSGAKKGGATTWSVVAGAAIAAAYKQGRVRLFYRSLAKLSCHFDNVKYEGEILLDDIDDLLSGRYCCWLNFYRLFFG